MITSSGDGHPDEAIMYETARSDSMRELAYREGGGLEITLLWDERCDRLAVSIFDSKTGDGLALEAPGDVHSTSSTIRLRTRLLAHRSRRERAARYVK